MMSQPSTRLAMSTLLKTENQFYLTFIGFEIIYRRRANKCEILDSEQTNYSRRQSSGKSTEITF